MGGAVAHRRPSAASVIIVGRHVTALRDASRHRPCDAYHTRRSRKGHICLDAIAMLGLLV